MVTLLVKTTNQMLPREQEDTVQDFPVPYFCEKD